MIQTTGKSDAELIKEESIAEEANLGAIKDDGEILEYELTKAAHKKFKN